MKTIIKLLVQIRFSAPLILFGWGLWLIIFHPFDTSVSFMLMSKLAPEWVYGVIYLIAGGFSFIVEIIFDKSPRHTKGTGVLRLAGPILVTVCWFFIWILFFLTNPTTTAVYIYGVLFVISFVNFMDISELYNWRNGFH